MALFGDLSRLTAVLKIWMIAHLPVVGQDRLFEMTKMACILGVTGVWLFKTFIVLLYCMGNLGDRDLGVGCGEGTAC